MNKKLTVVLFSTIIIVISVILFSISGLRANKSTSTFDMSNIVYNPIFITIATLFSVYYIYIAIKFINNGLKNNR